MSPIWLIDFDDSFTHNIASEFFHMGLECQVISWRDWTPPTTSCPRLLVLGPGPGHPDDYQVEELMIQWWKTEVPLAGICLGHQLMARFLGLSVITSERPRHGEAVTLSVPGDWQKAMLWPSQVKVQRYNSLAVKGQRLPTGWRGWKVADEWIALSHKRALTYQFHPESVGTTCPEVFFKSLHRLAL